MNALTLLPETSAGRRRRVDLAITATTSIRDIAVRRWSSLRKLMPGGSFNAQPTWSPDVYEGGLTWDFTVERVTGIEPALSARELDLSCAMT